MFDTVVRLTLLGLLFAGLFGVWIWSRRQATARGPIPTHNGQNLRITQKRWIDQRTGVCQVEVAGQTFLLAYTAGGVSWQPLSKPKADEDKVEALLDTILPDEMPVETGRR